jgi:hypothetical protein
MTIFVMAVPIGSGFVLYSSRLTDWHAVFVVDHRQPIVFKGGSGLAELSRLAMFGSQTGVSTYYVYLSNSRLSPTSSLNLLFTLLVDQPWSNHPPRALNIPFI